MAAVTHGMVGCWIDVPYIDPLFEPLEELLLKDLIIQQSVMALLFYIRIKNKLHMDTHSAGLPTLTNFL